VDASQNVGIGTASPAYALDVGGTLANIRVAPSTTTNNALTRYVNTGGTGYVGLDSSAGGLTAAYALNLYHTGAYPIVFSTSGTARMRINAGAPILCLSGGNTSATGTGIAFPATQSASTDANTLDDYEEGTWSPTLVNCGGSASASGATYVKIGNVVTARLTIVSGTFTLNSSRFTLPFSSADFSTGTFSISTQIGGFLEAQVSTVCYFATTASGSAYCSITYITS
jgi:hypothetical protein